MIPITNLPQALNKAEGCLVISKKAYLQLKRPANSALKHAQHEVDVTWRLLLSNAPGFLFIHIGGFLARLVRARLPLYVVTGEFLGVMGLCLLCSSVFDIANQTSSPEEDSVNKPHRPIPAGLITLQQAKRRWIMAWIVGPLLLGTLFGSWPMLQMLQWELLIYTCYVWPQWNNFFMRNFFAAYGYCILQRLIDFVIARNASEWRLSHIIDPIVFAWFMGTVHIQEFYDLEGDRKSGRRTLPMMLSPKGLKLLRAGTSVYIIVFGTALSYAGCKAAHKSSLIIPLTILQQVSSTILAYRIVASRSMEMDKATYQKCPTTTATASSLTVKPVTDVLKAFEDFGFMIPGNLYLCHICGPEEVLRKTP